MKYYWLANEWHLFSRTSLSLSHAEKEQEKERSTHNNYCTKKKHTHTQTKDMHACICHDVEVSHSVIQRHKSEKRRRSKQYTVSRFENFSLLLPPKKKRKKRTIHAHSITTVLYYCSTKNKAKKHKQKRYACICICFWRSWSHSFIQSFNGTTRKEIKKKELTYYVTKAKAKQLQKQLI
jgi:hypothetical protein